MTIRHLSCAHNIAIDLGGCEPFALGRWFATGAREGNRSSNSRHSDFFSIFRVRLQRLQDWSFPFCVRSFLSYHVLPRRCSSDFTVRLKSMDPRALSDRTNASEERSILHTTSCLATPAHLPFSTIFVKILTRIYFLLKIENWKLENGNWKMGIGRWKLENENLKFKLQNGIAQWQLEDENLNGNWKMKIRKWKLEDENWKMEFEK